MTYLNDVKDGGTEFFYQKLKTPAKKGLTLIWPWSHTKLEKVQQIIEHYTQKAFKDNVISLEEYREVKKHVR